MATLTHFNIETRSEPFVSGLVSLAMHFGEGVEAIVAELAQGGAAPQHIQRLLFVNVTSVAFIGWDVDIQFNGRYCEDATPEQWTESWRHALAGLL